MIIANDKRMNDLDLVRTKGSMHPKMDKLQVFSWHCVYVPIMSEVVQICCYVGFQEISVNYNWLLPICKESPTKAGLKKRFSLLFFQNVSKHVDLVGQFRVSFPLDFCAQVQSAFYLIDALLALDKLMGSCLLVPLDGMTKKDVAAEESKRLKRLLGSLRHLFRNCYLVC